MAKELLVETFNREALDKILLTMGGLIGETPVRKNIYAVRSVNGDVSFLKFAIEKQGYAKIIEERQIQGDPK